jgi:helicase
MGFVNYRELSHWTCGSFWRKKRTIEEPALKYSYPESHGLSETTKAHLVHLDEDGPSLTNAQHASLAAGVGRGESVLVVSPTSTGKTQIALWAMANSLESGTRTVYLVTHKALAKQKFEDFQHLLLPHYLDNDRANLVIATGDYIRDADGENPKDPLGAALIVATYEKYLAMLSATGVPSNMSRVVVVCDEIQLLGDAYRGQSVEVLLALLRTAGWKQFVGLSAVMQRKDAQDLADWLDVKLVVESQREKHLAYECWTHGGKYVCKTENAEEVSYDEAVPVGVGINVALVVKHLLAHRNPPIPIIVFCMKKQAVSDLANEFMRIASNVKNGQLSLAFDALPETSANAFLAQTLESRVAIHNADLTDEERHIIERHLADGKIDVVFATSTLAAGVNFPFGAAIFAEWKRWDFDQNARLPIDSSEFHNMAGRVGRMGSGHENGRVIFFASNQNELRDARKYLDISDLPFLESRISPNKFDHLALQLVASGLCSSKDDLVQLVCQTLSAIREQSRNAKAFALWPQKLLNAVSQLIEDGFLLSDSSGGLVATQAGKAVGFSGLLPSTSTYLLNYLAVKAPSLSSYLPDEGKPGQSETLAFAIFHACLSSPEFRGKTRTRPIPYQIDQNKQLFNPSGLAQDLVEPFWHTNMVAVNAAKMAVDWINGESLRNLENTFPTLGAGALMEMFKNLSWVMQGLSGIISAAGDERVMPELRPKSLRSHPDLKSLSKFARTISRLALRLSEGLPDDVLWMNSLNLPGTIFKIQRSEILALRALGVSSPEMLMLSTPEADLARATAFSKVKPAPQVKSNWLRDSVRAWKATQRRRFEERHLKRAVKCGMDSLFADYYQSRETAFEQALERIFQHLLIPYTKLDGKGKTGAPDYLLELQDSTPIVLEVKTKLNAKLVDYNSAVEVVAAATIHGYPSAFCTTLCHPGVDPSVAPVIVSCGKLSVVEGHDLAEALLRVGEGALSQAQLWRWLATPGQALAADIPFKDNGKAL